MKASSFVFLLVAFLGPLTSLRAAERPNIVFFLADDLGWTGLRCFGSDFYETPNLDALAKSGVKFTQAYAACTVCSPTRASIMTGKYPARLRLTDFIAGQNRPWAKMRIPNWTKGLAHEEETLAEILRKAGYRTGHVGKWHLERPGKPKEDGPTFHGFDVSIQRPPGTRGYLLKDGSYLTDYLTDQSLTFLAESKKQEKPFFLCFAYHVPHTPVQGRKDLVEAFQKKVNPKAIHKNPNYAAMVSSLDHSVGRVLKQLDKLGLSKNTLVVFTSDNGGLTQRYGKHDGFTENLPLRRGKGSAYEGGVRVPTIIRWPGKTSAGTTCEEPIASIDFYPTFAEMAKAAIKDVDGLSLTTLLAQPKTSLKRDLFWHHPHYHAGGDGPYSAVRSGDWRLIEFHEDQRLELYDLKTDLGEKTNLALTKPERAKELYEKLVAWRRSIKAQMPTVNPDYDPDRATKVERRPRRRK